MNKNISEKGMKILAACDHNRERIEKEIHEFSRALLAIQRKMMFLYDELDMIKSAEAYVKDILL